ncbi:hypothetical protein NMY22_g3527 [Coprinellus aureogranulatus]|nr:hypothetical protein NMY22_g3527 [Coprinellus aureogranulatus]
MPFWPAKKSKKDKKEKKSKKGKEPAQEEVSAEDEHEPIDVLTDVIIGFLEASTSYMRTIANVAFGYLSALVKESTVDLLVAQLERRSPAELAANDDEEDEDVDMDDAEAEDEAEEDEEGDEDEEKAEDEAEDEDADSSGSESFGEIDLGDDDEDEEIDLELRKKIEEALRINGIKPATEDDDDEEEEEDLMDDDQMMAIDAQLAKVFQARASEKKGAKNANAQREATHFKNRVLDLVEIFMRKHATNPQVPRFILPLVEVVASSGQDEMQLRDKAKGILRSRISKAKEYPSEVDADQVAETMEALHTQAKKTHGSDIMEILGTSSVYLAKILAQAGKDSTVEEVYRKSLEDFMTRKNSTFNTAFFKVFFQRQPIQAWKLRRSLLELADKAINGYRQVQALQLAEVLVTQIPSMDDQAGAVKDYMPTLRESLVDLATKACTDDKSKFTAPQMKEVLKLALAAARQTKRFAEGSVTEIWQPDSWLSLKQSLVKSSRFSSSTGLHKMCDQMVQLAGGQSKDSKGKAKVNDKEKEKKKSPAKRKRKADDDDAAAEPAPKVKTKKAKVKAVSS